MLPGEAWLSQDVAAVDAMHAMWLSATSRLPAATARRRSRAVVAELVGPAGAGKTTLRRAVASRAPSARAGVRVHRLRDLPAGALSALPALPKVAAHALAGRAARSWKCALQLVRLHALHRAVRRAALSSAGPVLLDEGPVFSLAKMRLLSGAAPADPVADRWRRALELWRRTLDLVVWIDAPDDLLARRIRDRPKAHRVKQASDAEIASFLARYRAAYGDVLSLLTAPGGPLLLRLETGAQPVDAAAADLLHALAALDRADP